MFRWCRRFYKTETSESERTEGSRAEGAAEEWAGRHFRREAARVCIVFTRRSQSGMVAERLLEEQNRSVQIQKIIEQLGYTRKEAKVYLAALGLGECHISDIAAKADLPRTSAQIIVDKLHKDGLMNFYVMRRYKYWVAENPERILENFQRREEAMRAALPSLVAMRSAARGRKRRGTDGDVQVSLLRMLANSSFQPVLIANENVEIEYVNAAWEDQFGYTLEEVRGENPRILQSGKTPRAVYERMWKALRAEKMFQSDEIIDKKKDGSFFKLLTTIFPVKRGNRLFYIQILDDITGKKRVAEIRKKFLQTAV